MPAETRPTNFAAVVQPGIGVGAIRFGALASDVLATLGTPAEDRIDEDGDRLLAYPELGISLFSFAHDEHMRLVSYELCPGSEALLWDVQIFRVTRSMIAEAAAARGFALTEQPRHSDEGEMLLQIRSQSLDLYFEGESLSALTAGVVFSYDDTIEWPTTP